MKLCLFCTAPIVMLLANNVYANSIIEYIRNYDLNNYALGVAVSSNQSPYVGSENSTYAYPFLSSFRDAAFTDDWLVLKDGDVGVRLVKNNWELGLLGRIQTLGLGDTESLELNGLEERQWGLEIAPMIGWRGWPIHVNFKTYSEVTGNHNGKVSQLAFSWPQEWSRGYLIPSIEAVHQTKGYANYYYGISGLESAPGRPQYETGDDTINTVLKLGWGYKLGSKWLLSGSLKMTYLDSKISNSPIVDEEHLWSTNIGLAYNSNIFQVRESDNSTSGEPRTEFKISVFNGSINSKILFDSPLQGQDSEIDLEELLGVSDQVTVLKFDVGVRLGNYHRIEASYFEIDRNGLATLQEDLTVGDEVFVANTSLATNLESKIFRVAYSYSLMKDSQKELAVMAGLNFSRFKIESRADETGQLVNANHATPLPTLGAQASVALGQSTTLSAKAEVFRLEFDRYQGALTYITLGIQHRIGNSLGVGLEYNWFKTKLNANDESKGSISLLHQGPSLFVSARF